MWNECVVEKVCGSLGGDLGELGINAGGRKIVGSLWKVVGFVGFALVGFALVGCALV